MRPTHRRLSQTMSLLLGLALCMAPLSAFARTTPHDLPVRAAFDSPLGQEKIATDIAVYFGDQGHPAVAKQIRNGNTNKATRAMFRSDEEACEVAFLSAVVALQDQARIMGANAIINIRSTVSGTETGSATTYQCLAGAAIARVSLRGTYVLTR